MTSAGVESHEYGDTVWIEISEETGHIRKTNNKHQGEFNHQIQPSFDSGISWIGYQNAKKSQYRIVFVDFWKQKSPNVAILKVDLAERKIGGKVHK